MIIIIRGKKIIVASPFLNFYCIILFIHLFMTEQKQKNCYLSKRVLNNNDKLLSCTIRPGNIKEHRVLQLTQNS